jgi:hypothetical protein
MTIPQPCAGRPGRLSTEQPELNSWRAQLPLSPSGALLSGGKPGNPGHNQHTARQRAAAVRAGLVTELEGAAKDLSALLRAGKVAEHLRRY